MEAPPPLIHLFLSSLQHHLQPVFPCSFFSLILGGFDVFLNILSVLAVLQYSVCSSLLLSAEVHRDFCEMLLTAGPLLSGKTAAGTASSF